MNETNPVVDFYFNKAGQWQEGIIQLRKLLLSCGLTEELKWGCPCYTLQGKNIVLIHTFKAYGALLFFKGALLQDRDGILIQQTEQVQAARQFRFTNIDEINEWKSVLKAYVYEAIEVEKSGLKVDLKKTSAYPVPEEFEQKLTEIPDLKAAFETLTPGRQRAYLLYFAAPKQSKTRSSRIEKYIPIILSGKGLND